MRQPAWTRQWWQSKEINNVCKLKNNNDTNICRLCFYLPCFPFSHKKGYFWIDIFELDFKTTKIYCCYYTTRPRTIKDYTISCSKHWLVKLYFQFRHKTRTLCPFKWHKPFKPNAGIFPNESSTGQTLEDIGGLRGFFIVSCMEIKLKTVTSRPFLCDNFTLQPAL